MGHSAFHALRPLETEVAVAGFDRGHKALPDGSGRRDRLLKVLLEDAGKLVAELAEPVEVDVGMFQDGFAILQAESEGLGKILRGSRARVGAYAVGPGGRSGESRIELGIILNVAALPSVGDVAELVEERVL